MYENINPSTLDGCMFTDGRKTTYLVRYVESDISRLIWREGVGTCLDPTLPRKFELRVFEVEQLPDSNILKNYGLSGQFRNVDELIEHYGIRLYDIHQLN